ncbi:MAG: hypothetical protein ACRDL5_06485 [Solirubrobacteraceae bacterium]
MVVIVIVIMIMIVVMTLVVMLVVVLVLLVHARQSLTRVLPAWNLGFRTFEAVTV